MIVLELLILALLVYAYFKTYLKKDELIDKLVDWIHDNLLTRRK